MARTKKKAVAKNILKPSRWREYIAILLAVFAILMAIALFSYNSSDWDSLGASPPVNAIGRAGAVISYILFHGIGVSVYAFPLLILMLSVMIFMRFAFPSVKTIVLRLVTLCALMITAACLAHIIYPDTVAYLNIPSAGGIIGKNITQSLMIPFSGTIGSTIILLGLTTIELLFLFDTSLRSAWKLAAWFGKIGTPLFDMIGRGVITLSKMLSAAGQWAFDKTIGTFRRFQFNHQKIETKIVITGQKRTKDLKNNAAPASVKPYRKPDISQPTANQEINKTVPQQAEKPKAPLPDIPAPVSTEIEDLDSADKDLPPYNMPETAMLDEPDDDDTGELMHTVARATEKLRETLTQFGIDAHVGSAICGPVITCYEVQPAPGVKVSKITSLENDLALAMKAQSIRIVAPIPGRDAVGIELPNEKRRMVTFAELIHSPEYHKQSKHMNLLLALGQTLSGETFSDDMADMPHLLVAGATGSGKSVCINTILLSLLFRFEPHELKLVLVDPKHVELVPYHNLPHLLLPVLNEPGKVPDALDWLIGEMERRYRYFARLGVRNISMFNQKRETDTRELAVQVGGTEKTLPGYLPYIVLIVDELADLMMVAADEIERKIIRLAQLARAAGIHMVLATQRPSTNVITGLIKANIPARIAFRTTSNVDSRVIIDEPGSEKLLGKGDMLYKSPSVSRTMRIQGAFVSEEEVRRITDFIRDQREPRYVDLSTVKDNVDPFAIEMDDKFDAAIVAVLESGQASASYLQRRLQVGYARAARLVDLMEAHGIVGPKRGAKPRDILVEDWPPIVNDQ